MKEYLVRLAQIHESFRTAELRALAVMAGTKMEIVRYDDDVGVSFFFSVFSFNIFTSALIQAS
jgi:tRNA G10  N-methylase Trm11